MALQTVSKELVLLHCYCGHYNRRMLEDLIATEEDSFGKIIVHFNFLKLNSEIGISNLFRIYIPIQFLNEILHI